MTLAIQVACMPKPSKGREWAESMITRHHYLHRMPDPRTSYEIFSVLVGARLMGALVIGRPEATRCADWYGSVEDVRTGRCAVTRWQVLNLARVWIHPEYQAGGAMCRPDVVPGFADRRGQFQSTLTSAVLRVAVQVIGYEYLKQRPPCFLDEPYEIKWLLSYCNTHLHRGTIYAASDFELYRLNGDGIQTWRIPTPSLTAEQDRVVQDIAKVHPRSVKYRAKRAQMQLGI